MMNHLAWPRVWGEAASEWMVQVCTWTAPGPAAVAGDQGLSLPESPPVAVETAECALEAAAGAFRGVASHCRSGSGSVVGTDGLK